MTTPENKVKQAIDAKLRDLKAYWYNPVPTGFGTKGVPDKLACVPVEITQDMVGKTIGVFVGIEAKAGMNTTTPLQDIQLKKIKASGGKSFVVRDQVSLDAMVSEVFTFTDESEEEEV